MTEVRPCDACGGTIEPAFYRIRVSLALLDAKAANHAALVLGDEDAQLETTFVVCQACALGKPFDLGLLLERAVHARQSARYPAPASSQEDGDGQ